MSSSFLNPEIPVHWNFIETYQRKTNGRDQTHTSGNFLPYVPCPACPARPCHALSCPAMYGKSVCVCVCVYVCVCVCVRVRACVCVCVCVSLNMQGHACVRISRNFLSVRTQMTFVVQKLSEFNQIFKTLKNCNFKTENYGNYGSLTHLFLYLCVCVCVCVCVSCV